MILMKRFTKNKLKWVEEQSLKQLQILNITSEERKENLSYVGNWKTINNFPWNLMFLGVFAD